MTADPRIFVSYSSTDRDYAVVQRERIEAQGLAAQHFYDLGTPEQFDRLIAALKGPSRQLKAVVSSRRRMR